MVWRGRERWRTVIHLSTSASSLASTFSGSCEFRANVNAGIG